MIANIITVSRILLSLFLFVFSPSSSCFAVFYLLCGVTDVLDGFFARKLNTESKTGELLDSVADLFFAAAYAVKILPLLCVPAWIWIWTALIATEKIFGILQRSKKERRFYIAHSFANKLTGVLIFLLPLTLCLFDVKYGTVVVCAVATFAATEELFELKGTRKKENIMSYFKYSRKKIYYEEHGNGEALVLLHGNTVSGKFFTPVISMLAEKYRVITLDFLGCGQSDRIDEWPADLWYEWSGQVAALCDELGLSKVKLIGCSGGALVAINAALEKPELVECVVADSFEGLEADPEITEQIRMGRSFVKQNAEFCSMLKTMHGEDWESVVDADTEAVATHAKTIGSFFHKPLEELKVKLFLTGSDEDEMFPKGHYEKLFADICGRACMAKSHIFAHGGHPAMMSNTEEFISLFDEFSGKTN